MQRQWPSQVNLPVKTSPHETSPVTGLCLAQLWVCYQHSLTCCSGCVEVGDMGVQQLPTLLQKPSAVALLVRKRSHKDLGLSVTCEKRRKSFWSSSIRSFKCALRESGCRICIEPTKMSRDHFWRLISGDTNVEVSAWYPFSASDDMMEMGNI